jgi:hypothetical protein
MEKMYKAGAVSKNMFSVSLTNYDVDGKSGSRFVLGGYLLDKYAQKG